jgi:glutamate/tyrosine decarboxylase-like PLP-dependent enzyme
LRLNAQKRAELWTQAGQIIEQYLNEVDTLPVESLPSPQKLRERLAAFTFASPMNPAHAVDLVAQSMREMQTHVTHRRYFGLFNPAPTSAGITADALTAAFNPNLAAWSHGSFAVAAEEHVIRAIGSRFDDAFRYGTFTSGGGEANLTAVLCALTKKFRTYPQTGLRGLPRPPVAYVSAAAHHSLVKAARSSGLGIEALRIIPCDSSLGMDIAALAAAVRNDRANGFEPFLIVATAGATATGIIERLPQIAEIARAEDVWFHVDAAWGGLAALVPEMRHVLAGVERADSLTYDAHKSLSVPMAAGLFITRHEPILRETFFVSENYMPPATEEGQRIDPFITSLQWSRRFTGLKVLLSLAVAGWDGYAEALRHQVAMGDLLRERLSTAGYTIVNDTPLPLVCFVRDDEEFDAGSIAQAVVQRGDAWISATSLPNGRAVLRAAITNYLTGPDDIAALVAVLAC